MRTVTRRRLGVAAALCGLVLATPVVPAAAGDGGGRDIGDHWVLTGRAGVAAGERADNVVVLNGDALIAGEVDGLVFVLNGDVGVTGRVDGDVTALRGRVTVGEGARIDGDVLSGKRAEVAPGARVDGDVDRVREFRGAAIGFGTIAVWLAVSFSAIVLGLALVFLAPRLLEGARAVAGDRAALATVVGFGVAVGLPIVGLVLVATIIGLPLGVAVLLALFLVFMIGYVTSAFALGRRILPARPGWLAFVLGWAILRVVALVPVLGQIVTIAATVFGLGLMAIALWATRSAPATRAQPATA